MENIKSQLYKIIRSQVDVIQKLQALINDKKVPDPEGLAKTTLLYALQQRHDFVGVLSNIQKFKSWSWARGFAKRMQGRTNSSQQLTKEVLENSQLLLGALERMLRKHKQQFDQETLRQGRISTGAHTNHTACLQSKVVRRPPKFAFKVEEVQEEPTRLNVNREKFIPIDPPNLSRYMENRADRANYLDERNNQKCQTVWVPTSSQREPLSTNRINSRNRKVKKHQKYRSILDEVESYAQQFNAKSVQKQPIHTPIDQAIKSPPELKKITTKHQLSFSYSPNSKKEVRLSSNKKVIDRIQQQIKQSEEVIKKVMKQEEEVEVPRSNQLYSKVQKSELDRTFRQCPCYVSSFGFSDMVKAMKGDTLIKFMSSLQ